MKFSRKTELWCIKLGTEVLRRHTVVLEQNCQLRHYLRGDRRNVTVMRPDFVLVAYATVSYLHGRKVYC